MDAYDWDSVSDVPEKFKKEKYRKSVLEFLKRQMREAGIKFSGSVLDLCCGPISFGAVYDNVVGYDIKPRFIKILRKAGIKGIIGGALFRIEEEHCLFLTDINDSNLKKYI